MSRRLSHKSCLVQDDDIGLNSTSCFHNSSINQQGSSPSVRRFSQESCVRRSCSENNAFPIEHQNAVESSNLISRYLPFFHKQNTPIVYSRINEALSSTRIAVGLLISRRDSKNFFPAGEGLLRQFAELRAPTSRELFRPMGRGGGSGWRSGRQEERPRSGAGKSE